MAVPGSSVGQGFQLKQQLRALLERHGITAAELSRRSGVPKQVLSLWLGGVEPRKLTQLKLVAEVFKVTVDELCFGRLAESAVSGPGTQIEGVFEGRLRRISDGGSSR